MARDPNDKTGSQGAQQLRYLSGEEPLRYSIFLENQATATAPAQEVIITDQLDATKMDLTTFSLGPISFGDRQVIPPPGLKQYSTEVDLRPTKNLIVRISALLDAMGVVTWRFVSIDPATGQLPEDPLGGFLPPNVNPPEGDGSMVFTVMPKMGLTTGTEIRNKAAIVFDVNAPIDTPVWLNTLDNTKPTSQVQALADTQFSALFDIQWAGADEHAGILDYSIFVSEDGGPFTPFLSNTPNTSLTFTGQSGKTYAFYSIARDGAGNVEDPPAVPDTSTQVVAAADAIPPTTTATPTPAANANGWNNSNVTFNLSAVDNDGGSGVKEISYTLSGAQPGGSVDAGGSTSVTISAEGITTLTYFASDIAGNAEAPRTLTIQIDKTQPVVTATRTPSANGFGWNNTDVTAHFTATDSPSGIDGASSLDVLFTPEGANQSVTRTFTDQAGNSTSATVSGISIDRTAPTVACTANPSRLWPPNHKLASITTSVTVADTLSGQAGFTLTAVTSNEADKGLGDGDQANDIQGWAIGTADTGGQLRAERSDTGTGRVYALTYNGADKAGNATSCRSTVTVPHDQGN